jgi:hypothetical protein
LRHFSGQQPFVKPSLILVGVYNADFGHRHKENTLGYKMHYKKTGFDMRNELDLSSKAKVCVSCRKQSGKEGA